MPDDSGKLTDDDIAKVRAWLTERTGGDKCPSCGTNDWTLVPTAVTPMAIGKGVVFGQATPMVLVACNHCGLLLHYSAVMIGLYPNAGGEGKSNG
jgi:hypothetical protein